MVTKKEFIEKIKSSLILRNDKFKYFFVIDEKIRWAWDNWEDDIVSSFYTGEKPDMPTEIFISEWIDNEDWDQLYEQEQQ